MKVTSKRIIVIDMIVWIVVSMTILGALNFFSYRSIRLENEEAVTANALTRVVSVLEKEARILSQDILVLSYEVLQDSPQARIKEWMDERNYISEVYYYDSDRQPLYHIISEGADELIQESSITGTLFYQSMISEVVTPNKMLVYYKSENGYLLLGLKTRDFLSTIDVDNDKYVVLDEYGLVVVANGFYNNNVDEAFLTSNLTKEKPLDLLGHMYQVRMVGDYVDYIADLRVYVIQYLAVLMLTLLVGSVVIWRLLRTVMLGE